MRPFFLWAGQIFVFCSVLGLVAMDYRLLRENEFGARELRAIHNIPALSAYATTVVGGVIAAVLAGLTGRLTDFVTFFLEQILPRAPGAGG